MIKTIMILPDGREVSSGSGTANAVQSAVITQSVNVGDELTLGSAFANIFEATLITPGGALQLAAGEDVEIWHEDDDGERKQIGVFTMEKPTKSSANRMKVVGYDHIAKLDKELDLETVLSADTTLPEFASAVCTACGLTFDESTVPDSFADLIVYKFTQAGVTGRQLMRWAAEVCGRFCRADAAGVIGFGWYTDAEVSIAASGENYYFSGGLSYEDYTVAAIDAVQMRLADDEESGYLWPDVAEGANTYIITENPILLAHGTTAETQALLNTLRDHLAENYAGCVPCKVSLPAYVDVQAGDKVQITDKNGVTITTYVMTRTQNGQRAELECTGSLRRDSAAAVAERTEKTLTEIAIGNAVTALKKYADKAADTAVEEQTQEDIFNKLTNNGETQGIFIKDGKLYINASYMVAGKIVSGDTSGGYFVIDLDNGEIESVANAADEYGVQLAALLNSGKLVFTDKSTGAVIQELTSTGGYASHTMKAGHLRIRQVIEEQNGIPFAKICVEVLDDDGNVQATRLSITTGSAIGTYIKGLELLEADASGDYAVSKLYVDNVQSSLQGGIDYIGTELNNLRLKAQQVTAGELDSWYRPGFFYLAETLTIENVTANYWFGFNEVYEYGDHHAVQHIRAISGKVYNDLERKRYQGAWGSWEWTNPPMALGTEYRTTERWQNKPVYVQAIDCGSLPAATLKAISTGIPAEQMVDFRVNVLSSSGAKHIMPLVSSDFTVQARAVILTNGVLQFKTSIDMSEYTAIAVIKYVKE